MPLRATNIRRTRALIHQWRKLAPRRTRKRLPRQQQPDQLRREYWRAILPICRRARDMVAPVIEEILAELRAHRPEQDAAEPPPAEVGTYGALLAEIMVQAEKCGAAVRTYGTTAAGPLVCVEVEGPRAVVIVTGQHGEEQAGPRMVARFLPALAARARSRGLGLRIYPCVNPEGFNSGTRRDRKGDTRANAFLDYMVGGAWVGEPQPGQVATATRRPAQAPETRALYDDLVPWASTHPVAALVDLHQDACLRPGYAFAYVTKTCRDVAARALARAALPYASRKLANASWSKVALRTGPDGCCLLEDGSITAWADHAGIPISVALEVDLWDVPSAARVHRAFVCGILDAASQQAEGHADAGGGGMGGRQAAHEIRRVAEKFAATLKTSAIADVAAQFGKRTADWQKGQLDAQVRAAFGVQYEAIEQPTRDRVPGFVAENVALIVTVPERYLERVAVDVEDAYASGMHPSTLAEDLQDDYDMSERDAMRLARDQVSKLNAAVNQDRLESLGVTEYYWRCSNDNRVRDNHQALDGQRCSWADPPMGGGTGPDDTGNAGEGICCRCFCEGILDDLLGTPDEAE